MILPNSLNIRSIYFVSAAAVDVYCDYQVRLYQELVIFFFRNVPDCKYFWFCGSEDELLDTSA